MLASLRNIREERLIIPLACVDNFIRLAVAWCLNNREKHSLFRQETGYDGAHATMPDLSLPGRPGRKGQGGFSETRRRGDAIGSILRRRREAPRSRRREIVPEAHAQSNKEKGPREKRPPIVLPLSRERQTSARAKGRFRDAAKPRPEKPSSAIAQVEGSGTAALPRVDRMIVSASTLCLVRKQASIQMAQVRTGRKSAASVRRPRPTHVPVLRRSINGAFASNMPSRRAQAIGSARAAPDRIALVDQSAAIRRSCASVAPGGLNLRKLEQQPSDSFPVRTFLARNKAQLLF